MKAVDRCHRKTTGCTLWRLHLHSSCSTPARSPQVITNVLASVAIALAALGFAAPASADPNQFSNLSCSCPSPLEVGPAGPGQIIQGIRDGLADVQAAQR